MRSAIIVAAVTSLAIGHSFAQNANPPANPAAPPPTTQVQPVPPPAGAQPATPANPNAPANPAVKTTEGNNPGAPAVGANSFTESQAKAHIESRGYSNVSALKKDDKGVWRGAAMKDGKPVQVSLDFQGNVVVD